MLSPFACVRGLGGCPYPPFVKRKGARGMPALRSHAGLLTATMRFRYLYEDNRN